MKLNRFLWFGIFGTFSLGLTLCQAQTKPVSLDGTYLNSPIVDSLPKAFREDLSYASVMEWKLSEQFFKPKMETKIQADSVKIQTKNKKTLEVTFYNQGVGKPFEIKGKFKEDHFRVQTKRKVYFPPIPPIYYREEKSKIKLRKNNLNQLVLEIIDKKNSYLLMQTGGTNKVKPQVYFYDSTQ